MSGTNGLLVSVSVVIFFLAWMAIGIVVCYHQPTMPIPPRPPDGYRRPPYVAPKPEPPSRLSNSWQWFIKNIRFWHWDDPE